MTGAVHEVLAVSRSLDDRAGRGVDALRGDARGDVRARRLLRREQDGVVLGELRRRGAHGVGAGLVGAVAVGHRAADVDDDRVAGLDDAVGELVVRAGAVRPARDDDEVDAHVALGDDRVGDVLADLALGASGAQPVRHARVHPVDRRARAAQRLRPRRASCGSAARAARHRPAPARTPGIAARSRSTFSAHMWLSSAAVPVRRQRRRDQGVRVVGLAPGQHLEAQRTDGARERGRLLQTGHHDVRVAGPRAPRGRSGARAGSRRSRSGSAGPVRG